MQSIALQRCSVGLPAPRVRGIRRAPVLSASFSEAASTCGSTSAPPPVGAASQGGCGKGSCGSCGSASSTSDSMEAILKGVGAMSPLMGNAGISREDIAEAFAAAPSQASTQRIWTLSELLANCPDEEDWEDEPL